MNRNSVERFSNRVENYVKYRPHYPKEIIRFLSDECGLTPSGVVADIGSGPGISSENFIENGNTVYAVEPNEIMRAAAGKIFSGSKNFISVNGTAEATTLSDGIIDLIIAGQAFHWFDKEKCKIEFQRILKEDGHAVFMWNEKTDSNDFMKSYFGLLEEFGTDYGAVKHENIDDEFMEKFFFPDSCKKKLIAHRQSLDCNGLEGRLLSSSYIPLEGKEHEALMKKLKNIFEEYNITGKVEMDYETILYYGKLK